MNPISYLPGASYEEQLRIWENGNEDEHRLAVFLEEQKEKAYRKGFEEGRKYLRDSR